MGSTSEKTRRIAKNTFLLYVRSLLSLIISLSTSRLVLHALGEDDFGIYGVVGGFVSMFTIVSGSLSGAISRFMNFALGKEDEKDLEDTFSQSLNIMAILSLTVLLLTETFGIWFLHNKMNITPGREIAAAWCFQFSVLSTISAFMVVPFNATIIAHERMGVYAYLDIAEVFLKFLIALFLTFTGASIDKLVAYGALWLIVTLLKQLFAYIYSSRHFEEVKLRLFWSRQKFFEMFSYAGWSYIGKASGAFAGQGVNMVVNVVFGPAVNAARSLAGTVNHAVSIFVNNFTLAVNPQITQSYAAGDHEYMKSLIFRGTKFTFFTMYLIALPLMLETTFVVKLWLGEFPDHTVNFIRLSLLVNTVNILHIIHAMGIRATGKIAWFQLSFSFLEFLVFVFSYLLLHHGYAPEWAYFSALLVSCLQVLTMWYLSHKQLQVSIPLFIKTVVLPLGLVSILSAIIPAWIHFSMPMGWPRFIIVLITSLISSSVFILFVGCSNNERKMLVSIIANKITSIR